MFKYMNNEVETFSKIGCVVPILEVAKERITSLRNHPSPFCLSILEVDKTMDDQPEELTQHG